MTKACCLEKPAWKGMCKSCYQAAWQRRWRQKHPALAKAKDRACHLRYKERERAYNVRRYRENMRDPAFRESRRRPGAKRLVARADHEAAVGHPYRQHHRSDGTPFGCKTCRNIQEATRKRRRRPRPLTHLERFGHEKEFTRAKGRAKSICMVCARLRAGRVKMTDPATLEFVSLLRRDPCCYCGGAMEAVDHIEPFAKGGSSTWDNLTASCGRCNRAKNKRTLLLFLATRKAA